MCSLTRYAVTSDGGDHTVHVVIGIDQKRRIFLLDLWRQQTSSNVWIEAYCDLEQIPVEFTYNLRA